MCASGYVFKKGKSRANKATSKETSGKASRSMVRAKLRQKQITTLEEKITNLDEQITFKEKRRQQAEAVRNYKMCEEITEEMGIVKQQRRELKGELKVFQEKERKASWYARKKREATSSRESSMFSDDSEVPLSSRSSSQIGPESPMSPISIIVIWKSQIQSSGMNPSMNRAPTATYTTKVIQVLLCPGLPVLPVTVQEGSPTL